MRSELDEEFSSTFAGKTHIYTDWQQEVLLPPNVRKTIKTVNQLDGMYEADVRNNWAPSSTVDIQSLLHGRQISGDSFQGHSKLQNHLYSHPYPMRRLEPVSRMKGHRSLLKCLDWDSTGRYLVSGSEDGKLLIWEPFSMDTLQETCGNYMNVLKPLYSVPIPVNSGLMDVKFMSLSESEDADFPGGLISCFGNGKVLYTDLKMFLECQGSGTFQQNRAFNCHGDIATGIELDPLGPGNVFFSCSDDGTVNQYDLRIRTSCQCSHCNRHTLIDICASPTRFHRGQKMAVDCKSLGGIKGQYSSDSFRSEQGQLLNRGLGISCMTINPVNPMHIALGLTNGFVQIYDRRFLESPADEAVDLQNSDDDSAANLPPSINSFEALVYEHMSSQARLKKLSTTVGKDKIPLTLLGKDTVSEHAFVTAGFDIDSLLSDKVTSELVDPCYLDDSKSENGDDETSTEDGEDEDDNDEASEDDLDNDDNDEIDYEDSNHGRVYCHECSTYHDISDDQDTEAAPRNVFMPNFNRVIGIKYDPCGSGELLVSMFGDEIYRVRPSHMRTKKWNGLTADFDPKGIYWSTEDGKVKRVERTFKRGIIWSQTATMLLPFYEEIHKYQYDQDILQVYQGRVSNSCMLMDVAFFGTNTGNSSYIISGSDDGNVSIWKKENSFDKYSLPVTRFQYDSKGIIYVRPNPTIPVVAVSGLHGDPVILMSKKADHGYELIQAEKPTWDNDADHDLKYSINTERRSILEDVYQNNPMLFEKVAQRYSMNSKIPRKVINAEAKEYDRITDIIEQQMQNDPNFLAFQRMILHSMFHELGESGEID